MDTKKGICSHCQEKNTNCIEAECDYCHKIKIFYYVEVFPVGPPPPQRRKRKCNNCKAEEHSQWLHQQFS